MKFHTTCKADSDTMTRFKPEPKPEEKLYQPTNWTAWEIEREKTQKHIAEVLKNTDRIIAEGKAQKQAKDAAEGTGAGREGRKSEKRLK